MVINADTLIVDDLGRLVADVHSIPCDPLDGEGKSGAGNYGGSGKLQNIHIQIPLTGYVGFIYCSATVTTASWTSCKCIESIHFTDA